MSKNNSISRSVEPEQITIGSRMIINKTESGLIISDHITVDTLEIRGRVEFTATVNVPHCIIDRTLCPNFEGNGRIYDIDDKIILSGDVMFLDGFHCPDVNFV